eukprot:COSAG02_NODE_61297_length_269_cov_0.600000_1_plen_72_part_10
MVTLTGRAESCLVTLRTSVELRRPVRYTLANACAIPHPVFMHNTTASISKRHSYAAGVLRLSWDTCEAQLTL